MKCLFCDSDTSVIETRVIDGGRKTVRRRACRHGHRFRTTEAVGGVLLRKEAGHLEPFDRGKVAEGAEKALYKRVAPSNAATRKAWEIAEEVESELLERIRERGSIEVEPWEVGELVLMCLKKADWLAWLRYLSVLYDEKETVPAVRRGELQGQIDNLLDEILEVRR